MHVTALSCIPVRFQISARHLKVMIYLAGRDIEKTTDETKSVRRESEEDKEESVDKRRNRISIDTYIQSRRERNAPRRCKVGFIFAADHRQRHFVPSGGPFVSWMILGTRCFTAGIDCGYINQSHDFQKNPKATEISRDRKKKDTDVYIYKVERLLDY